MSHDCAKFVSAPRELLAVFARAPELGRVKTRLCPPLTADEALALHRALVGDTLERFGKIQRVSMDRLLLLSEPLRRADDLDIPRSWMVVIQSSGDLGVRLASLFDLNLRRGVQRVVVLGSDSPTLPVEVIEEAFHRLEKVDVVLGPAEDGGYYLVGCRRFVPQMFRDIAWGTQNVLEATKRALEESGCTFKLLVPWYDVDRSEDLSKLREEIEYLKRSAPELIPRRVATVLPASPNVGW